jgi:hypothetical protein
MPLTKKGKKIMNAMKEEYGDKKGEGIFYASKNKKTIVGVEKRLLGGLLTAGIKYGLKRYTKTTGKKLIDLTKGQSKKLAKADKVSAIKLEGGAELSKLDKIKLDYYKDIL